MQLRDYQQQVFDNFVKRYENKSKKNTVNCLPTGTGKSVIILKQVQYLLKHPNIKIGIVVPTIELLDNLERYFKSQYLSIFVDKLGRGTPNPDKRIYIGVYKTFKNRLGELPPIDVFIHDECHHIACDTWQYLITENNAWHEGFTASPKRLDGQPLWGFDDIYEPYTISWYMKKGFLCPNLVEYCAEQLINVSLDSVKDNLHEQWESTKGKLHGSIVDSWLEHGENGQTILYATTLEHCQLLKETFNDKLPDLPVEIITSKNTKKQRQELLKGFRDKRIKMLINVNVLTEGVDIPDCSVISACRFWGNIAGYTQAVGRILRPQEGKKAIFIDHAGNLAHGSVKNIYGWTEQFFDAFEEFEEREAVEKLERIGVEIKKRDNKEEQDTSRLVMYNLSAISEAYIKASKIESWSKMFKFWQGFLKRNKVTRTEFDDICKVCSTVVDIRKARTDLLSSIVN